MKSLVQKYYEENEGLTLVERESFFFTYKVIPQDKQIYIAHIYIDSDVRGGKIAPFIDKELHDLAKEHNCDTLVGDVDIQFNDPEHSLVFLIKHGFVIDRIDNNHLIYLYRKLT